MSSSPFTGKNVKQFNALHIKDVDQYGCDESMELKNGSLVFSVLAHKAYAEAHGINSIKDEVASLNDPGDATPYGSYH